MGVCVSRTVSENKPQYIMSFLTFHMSAGAQTRPGNTRERRRGREEEESNTTDGFSAAASSVILNLL